MRLCVVTCTYGRPHLLPRVIKCFQSQDYADKRMLVLDDGAQYQSQWIGEDIRLISMADRYPSLGIKRNASIKFAYDIFGGVDAVLPCDDDDIFLPHHLSSAAAALDHAEWSRPSVILAARVIGDTWIFTQNYTGHRSDPTKERLYHPAWAFTVDAWRRAGGYPEHLSGPEDQGLMRSMEALGITQSDPIALGAKPSYVYMWGNSNISGRLNIHDPTGEKAWASLEQKLEPAVLEPWSPPFDLHAPLVAPNVLPRPF